MGKRSKLFKGGLCKKNYKLVLKSKDKLNTTKLNTTTIKPIPNDSMVEESDNSMVMIGEKDKLNRTTVSRAHYDEYALNKHNSVLGINPELLRSYIENPSKHRRQKNNTVLSKRQKRKMEIREKFERKKVLVEKIKLNQSMMGRTNTSLLNKTNFAEDKPKGGNFNLNDINMTLNNLLDEIKENKTEETTKGKSAQKRNKRADRKMLLAEEKEKIQKVISNMTYQTNPNEVMKQHLKAAHIIKERNKKLSEHFDKNYNLLKLKPTHK